MAGEKVRPRCKDIDPKSTFYHQFEYNTSLFGLFDDADDGTPILIGSLNTLTAKLRSLPDNVTVFIYKKNLKKGYWEKKDQKKKMDGIFKHQT